MAKNKAGLKIAFQADANVDPDIWRGLCRREPNVDFQGHLGIIPDPDQEVLRLAGRVLVSSDLTMLVHFAEFVAHGESPDLILIPSSRSFGSVIESCYSCQEAVRPVRSSE